MPLVSLEGITVRSGATTILRGVDFELAAGEAVGIYGANGAGKTTLLRVVATLWPPAAGRGVVLGADLSSPDRFDVRPRIGMIGHVPGLYPELTLRENLLFAAAIAGIDAARVADALSAVGLSEAGDRRVTACSHGMQRRAEFAREMMLEPSLLLLDEPHSALDPAAVELVDHLAAEVAARGGAVMVVSHDLTRSASLVERTVEMAGGNLT